MILIQEHSISKQFCFSINLLRNICNNLHVLVILRYEDFNFVFANFAIWVCLTDVVFWLFVCVLLLFIQSCT